MSAARPKLQKARAWSAATVEQLFAEHPNDAVTIIAELASERDVVGTRAAYSTILQVLEYLVGNPSIDTAPLVPLLERFVDFPTWDPDGLRQFELVRNRSMSLLARRKHPGAKRLIERYVAAFPAGVETEYGASVGHELCMAARDLRDPSLAAPLRGLLETMLPLHSKRQRNNALGAAYAILDALESTNG